MLRLLLILFLPVALFAQEQKSAPVATLARLGWLAGQWRLEKAGRVTDEYWMAPAGGVMLGMSRTVSKGKVLQHEFLQIREGPGGDLFYIALPVRQKETAFRAVAQTETDVVFENKEHDYPQIIGYSLKPDGSVVAYIEGPGPGGATKRIEYPYKRVP